MTTYTSEWITVSWPVGTDGIQDPVPVWLFAPGVTDYTAVATIRAASLTGSRTGDISVHVQDEGGFDLTRLSHTEFTIANGTTPTVTFSGSDTHAFIRFEVNGGGLLPHSSESFEYQITATFTSQASYCTYGVESNPDSVVWETLTETVINTIVATAMAGRAGPEAIAVTETALLAVEGSIGIALSCTRIPDASQEPLDIPNISEWSPERLSRWFQSAAWHFFCRCKAGTGGAPAPIPPPPPPVIEPPPTDGPAPLICDATDICAYLTQIKKLLDQMNRQISAVRTDVMFIQRQHVPKGYQNGTLHSGLTGTGSFTVSGILGLAVSLTASPPGIGSDMDSTARTYYGVGHVNVGTPDGWLHRVSIGHSPQLVLDIDPDVTQVEWSFVPGATASIRELLPLP